MSFDANAHRESSLQGWEEAAAGWVRSGERVRAFGAPVSHWMLDAVAPQPGQRVLELAARLGETGLLAAALGRWGYMLLAAPAASLAETRRVLRPGGRLALAVWDSIERNPWAALPG